MEFIKSPAPELLWAAHSMLISALSLSPSRSLPAFLAAVSSLLSIRQSWQNTWPTDIRVKCKLIHSNVAQFSKSPPMCGSVSFLNSFRLAAREREKERDIRFAFKLCKLLVSKSITVHLTLTTHTTILATIPADLACLRMHIDCPCVCRHSFCLTDHVRRARG